MTLINNRIATLRLKMKEQNLDAVIVPSSDPHQSEYVAEHWQFREWITGFSGSAGVAFFTHTHAGLSTDSRYFLQAEEELAESEVVLHKQKVPHTPQIIPWLIENLEEGAKVGIDPKLFSISTIRSHEKTLNNAGLELIFSADLIDQVWSDRPALPKDKIFELSLDYAGVSRQDKLRSIRSEMKTQGVDYHLVTTLDDIAWIFNIRGFDVASNPVAIAYAIIGGGDCSLFIDAQKVPDDLTSSFQSEQIQIKAYASVSKELAALHASKKILINPATTNGHLYNAIQLAEIIKGKTISTRMKALKNPVEIEHTKAAMRKDGVALTKLYRWLEDTLTSRSIPETEVADKLIEFRKAQGKYYGESFSAIVGYKGNGAIVHYRAQQNNCAAIRSEGILLIDSGGQYYNGTTDITRTITLGEPTAEQKRNYTLVLKGHIALGSLKFPEGTRGNQMEVLARKPLWEYGLNYGHGTGHGVGFFLNVHEGPQSFSSAAGGKAATVFEPGMITSNEPGFYKTDEYGIRIENLVLCIEGQETEYGKFLKFKNLTLFPIDTDLIDFPLLTKEEVDWLNEYHQEVYDQLAPVLNDDERAWLKDKCKEV